MFEKTRENVVIHSGLSLARFRQSIRHFFKMRLFSSISYHSAYLLMYVRTLPTNLLILEKCGYFITPQEFCLVAK